MSEIRTRTRRIKLKAAAERRDWNPKSDSAHYRAYRWWARKSGKAPWQENFCHYWRVVLIWAPLRWLVVPALYALALAALVGIGWVAIAHSNIVIAALILLYILYGALVGRQLLYDLIDSEKLTIAPVGWLENKPLTIRALAALSALPVVILYGVAALIIGTVFVVLISLHDDYDVYRRTGRWFTRVHFGNSKWTTWIRPWLILPVGMIVLSFFSKGVLIVTIALLTIAVVILSCFGLIVFSSFIVDKRRERRERQRRETYRRLNKPVVDRVMRVMFDVIHPKWAKDRTRFDAWRERYTRFCRQQTDSEYDKDIWWHICHLTPAQQREVQRRLDELDPQKTYLSRPLVDTPHRTTKKPSRFTVAWKAALSNVGDYLQLIWSVALAWKLKLCPWVKLPADG